VADETDKVVELLSGVLHPRVADALSGFLPGLFFETCLLLAEPQQTKALLAAARLDRPTELFITLLLAFVVGNAFIFWVRLIQIFLRIVFGAFHSWWPVLVEYRLIISANTRQSRADQKLQPGQQPRMLLSVRLARWAYSIELNRRANREFIQGAGGEAATALLKRYGVERPRNALVWINVLGAISPQEMRGFTLITSLHATGWAGLCAAYLAPELFALPFLALCAFLILCGLAHAGSLASWATHPGKSWVMALKNTWEELKTVGPVMPPNAPEAKDQSRKS